MVPRSRGQHTLALPALTGPLESQSAKTCTQIDSARVSLSFLASILISNMSTSTIISADEFQALEQKVLRAVEIVKRERETRAAAEAEIGALRAQLAAQLTSHSEEIGALQAQLATLNQERDAVRQRVEKVLTQIDELL